MKKITLQEKTQVANELLEEIKALHTPGEQVRFMEVCGTHTVAISAKGFVSCCRTVSSSSAARAVPYV